MPWAKVTGIMQKANYGWSLVTIRKEIPHKRDKTEGNQMRKKSPSTMAHPLGGGRGIRGRGYVRIGKNMIFIIVLLFGNNLQYEFNIWLQGVVIRTAPPTLSHTHTHTRARMKWFMRQLCGGFRHWNSGTFTCEIFSTWRIILVWQTC